MKKKTLAARVVRGERRDVDMSLAWVVRQYPQLSDWRCLATEWIKGETRGIASRLKAIGAFFERYLVKKNLPLDPAAFLARGLDLPDFYKTACPDTPHGVKYNNAIHDFLNFVLLRDYSEAADDGQLVVSPAFRNPISWRSRSGMPRLHESVHSPLPYGYIDELRQILAGGRDFCDWKWAQNVLGPEIGQSGNVACDWFEVTEEQIDKNDLDCVWRVRELHPQWRGGRVLEMWSPVRWVGLLVKLVLPLRTFQVRMLDSGEADTWRYAAGNWSLNESNIAEGTKRKPLQQGVFRRSNPQSDGEAVSTDLYITTNKTADIAKSGSEKGYVMQWFSGGQMHQDAYYWLEKLRNWQSKYNPVARRTAWTELDGRHIQAKSAVQLAGYPDACFLFRMPESGDVERHLPLKAFTLERPWFELLDALERRLAARGEVHSSGKPIRFVPTEQVSRKKTLFPLHSLRVSLITALALEGQVPFQILMKLVGHSRLLMTLYYFKPGATYKLEVLDDAAKKMEANKARSILTFLNDTEYGELKRQAICNSPSAFAAAIPHDPAARNPAGWMLMHHGLCLVGGNTSEIAENKAIGGCYNGGKNIGAPILPRHEPVPGGSRNCLRCRWFVTEPHYLKALEATFNTISYHVDEARNVCIAREIELQNLKNLKADAESVGQAFDRMQDLLQSERVWESEMKRYSDLCENQVPCWRLIERCMAALQNPQGGGVQLVAVGTLIDVKAVFDETESELLQVSGVCENVEVYPDLEPGKSIIRRSQLLDTFLYREKQKPLFMHLSEREQLLAGNALLRGLGRQINPANPALGQLEVIRLIDARESLSKRYGVDLSSFLPTATQAVTVGRQPQLADEA